MTKTTNLAHFREKKVQFFTCLLFNFLYLFSGGCTDPRDLVSPNHFTRVPGVMNLQGSVGYTSSGRRQVLLTWQYDTTNTNIRSWDVTRSVSDTAIVQFVPLEIVRRQISVSPFYIDSTATLQSFSADSVDLYYRLIPNGGDNYIGPPSDILHIVFHQSL